MANAKKNKFRWILGGAIVCIAIVAMSFLNLGDSLVYFYTPSEAIAKSAELGDKNIKVGGMVQAGTVDWKADDLKLSFLMSDNKGNDINVVHTGTPPDMFKEGQGVVVEGRLTDSGKKMISHNLLVKHSEEYQKPGDHSTMNKALLEKSLFKNEETK